MKRTIRLTESELKGMIQQTVKKALNEVEGKYMDYYPERSGFDPNVKWNKHDDFDEEQLIQLINDALTAINQARQFCRKNGDGDNYMFLNSIISEINHRFKLN